MTEERSAKITLGGDEYELILTRRLKKSLLTTVGLRTWVRNCLRARTLN